MSNIMAASVGRPVLSVTVTDQFSVSPGVMRLRIDSIFTVRASGMSMASMVIFSTD